MSQSQSSKPADSRVQRTEWASAAKGPSSSDGSQSAFQEKGAAKTPNEHASSCIPPKRVASHDELLYLQVLYPYATQDQLSSVFASAGGLDAAAMSAYEALNPDYAGFPYLEEQHEIDTRDGVPRTRRDTAFLGMKESLQERAGDTFRPGVYGNLSHLREYQETVGLFIVDTSDWDRAVLLPNHGLAETAFRHLPLQEVGAEETRSTEPSRRAEHTANKQAECLPQREALGTNGAEMRGSGGVVLNGKLNVDTNGHSNSLVTADASHAERSKQMSSPKQHERAPSGEVGGGFRGEGVVYLQSDDRPCAAPILSWAPIAIRVSSYEAQMEREGALRVFDEAAFFKDPLLHSARTPLQPRAREAESRDLSTAPFGVGDCSGPHVQDVVNMLRLPCANSEVHEPYAAHAEPLSQEKAAIKEKRKDVPRRLTSSVGDTSRIPEPIAACLPGESKDTQHEPSTRTRISTSNSTAEDSRAASLNFGHASTNTFPNEHHHIPMSRRDSVREMLRHRNPCDLAASAKVKERLRSLTPVGNFVFRESEGGFAELETLQNGTAERCRGAGSTAEGKPEMEGPASRTRQALLTPSHRPHETPDSLKEMVSGEEWMIGAAEEACREDRSLDGQFVPIPAAHSGCSNRNLVDFLNAEEDRWNAIVVMLAPYEHIYGSRYRWEVLRCVYEECPKFRDFLPVILRRLLHVVGESSGGTQLAEGLTEKAMKLPLLGHILISTSSVKLKEVVFREDESNIWFCDGGTALKVKLKAQKLALEPVEFAYISETDAAREAWQARQSSARSSAPHCHSDTSSVRGGHMRQYSKGVTRGTATITAERLRIKCVLRVLLSTSGKKLLLVEEVKVSLGSLNISTTVRRLDVMWALGSPLLRRIIQHALEGALTGRHTF